MMVAWPWTPRLLVVLVIFSQPIAIQGSKGVPKQCLDKYTDCVRQSQFQLCKKTVLTPEANVTILSVTQNKAKIRCVDYNYHNVIITPLFSWIRWSRPGDLELERLDLDNGSFRHVDNDGKKYSIESIVHKQDIHAQILTINDLNESDYQLYTCVICTHYGRSHHSIRLEPPVYATTKPVVPNMRPTNQPPSHPNHVTSRRALSPDPRTNRVSAIVFFVVGSLLVLAIIMAVALLIKYKFFKGTPPEEPTSPQPLFQESPVYSPVLTKHDSSERRSQRQCSSSTFTSSLRSSTSSATTPFKLRRNSSRSPANSGMTYISEISDGPEEVFEPPFDEEWEIARENIVLREKIGEGAFGLVVKGIVYGLPDKPSSCTVAVKTIKEDASIEEFNDFVSEIETMKSIGNHTNIINMVGVCSVDGPLLLIVEHAMHGNLRDFLRKHRGTHKDASQNNNLYMTPGNSLIIKNLLPMAYQAAKGMQYLASKKCIHRDLAARNVLLADDYVLKIADFGLSRNLRETDYYRKTTHGRLPVMWLSIEALFDQKYTLMSDVWSFGVLLWEIYTLGCMPYPGIPVERLFELLKTGYRMSAPTECPPEIYTLMLQCWSENPADRPTMELVAKELDRMLATSSSLEYLDILPNTSNETLFIQDDFITKQETVV